MHTSTEQSQTIPSLIWLAVLFLMHPLRMWLALLAARADVYSVCIHFAIDLNPQVLFCEADLQLLISCSVHISRIFLSQMENLSLLLLNFIQLVIAQPAISSRSLSRPFYP